jgi:hypothetical protein
MRCLQLDARADVIAATDWIICAGIGFGTGGISLQTTDDARRALVERIVHADIQLDRFPEIVGQLETGGGVGTDG